MDWQPIETAPKNVDVLVWYDHDADPYFDPSNPHSLTAYASWADGGPFMAGKGYAIAKWHPQFWESTDEYGSGYWLPPAWFAAENDDYERVCNPTHWKPLAPPAEAAPADASAALDRIRQEAADEALERVAKVADEKAKITEDDREFGVSEIDLALKGQARHFAAAIRALKGGAK